MVCILKLEGVIFMKDKELNEFIAKGHILCRVIFEMAGNPREHVEKTLTDYINKVKEDPDYIFIKEYQAPAEETEGVWSTFLEAEILVSDLDKLNLLCFNLGPASIEILRPEEMMLTDKKITNLYNDVISHIHETGVLLKSISNDNDMLKVNLNRSIRNGIILSAYEPRTLNEISEKTGIDTEHLQSFLEAMIKEKSLVKDGDKYHKKG
jgi:hypothetical protein